jgi:hypothetical protein
MIGNRARSRAIRARQRRDDAGRLLPEERGFLDPLWSDGALRLSHP